MTKGFKARIRRLTEEVLRQEVIAVGGKMAVETFIVRLETFPNWVALADDGDVDATMVLRALADMGADVVDLPPTCVACGRAFVDDGDNPKGPIVLRFLPGSALYQFSVLCAACAALPGKDVFDRLAGPDSEPFEVSRPGHA
jgi:hypothetical protein